MAFHRIASCVFLLALIAGSLSAITNVTSVSQTNLARWSQPTAPSSVATQGGNITNANITGASQLTTKFQPTQNAPIATSANSVGKIKLYAMVGTMPSGLPETRWQTPQMYHQWWFCAMVYRTNGTERGNCSTVDDVVARASFYGLNSAPPPL